MSDFGKGWICGALASVVIWFPLGYWHCRKIISKIAQDRISKEQHAEIFGLPLREADVIKYSKYDKDTR